MSRGPSLDQARRAGLVRAKLAALVARQWGPVDGAVPSGFPGGAALVAGSSGWVLAEERPASSLGPALAWAGAAGVETLHLLVPAAAGLLARRAGWFASPPRVWALQGAALVAARAEPFPDALPLPSGAASVADVVRSAGAEAVVEHGRLRAEVLGLEVARAVWEGGSWELEVGVGRHDREATRVLWGQEPAATRLARAVAAVHRHRRAGALPHPANQLARERWLRAVLVGRPGLVGATALVPADPPAAAADLAARAVAPAVGLDGDAGGVLIACSTGVDPDLVPAAADARAAAEQLAGSPLRLVLALPEGDDHPMTRALAARLVRPAEVRTLPRGWEALGPRSGPR